MFSTEKSLTRPRHTLTEKIAALAGLIVVCRR